MHCPCLGQGALPSGLSHPQGGPPTRPLRPQARSAWPRCQDPAERLARTLRAPHGCRRPESQATVPRPGGHRRTPHPWQGGAVSLRLAFEEEQSLAEREVKTCAAGMRGARPGPGARRALPSSPGDPRRQVLARGAPTEGPRRRRQQVPTDRRHWPDQGGAGTQTGSSGSGDGWPGSPEAHSGRCGAVPEFACRLPWGRICNLRGKQLNSSNLSFLV